jgi:hypothetical protein
MDAVGEYAAGLVAVVESGDAGEANARRVIDSAGALIKTFGAAYPAGAPAVELLNAAIVKTYGIYAKDKSARTVAEAIEYVTPAIEELAIILAEDLATIARIMEDHRRDELNAMYAERQNNEAQDLATLNTINQLRIEARREIALAEDLAESEALLATAQRWNDVYERELAMPWHADMLREKAAITQKYDGQLTLIRDASATLLAWGAAHEKLARASADGLAPSFAVLERLTSDLLNTYEEVRRHD